MGTTKSETMRGLRFHLKWELISQSTTEIDCNIYIGVCTAYIQNSGSEQPIYYSWQKQ